MLVRVIYNENTQNSVASINFSEVCHGQNVMLPAFVHV